jgi:hypothetical protein
MFRMLAYRYFQSRKGISLFAVSLMMSLMLHFVTPLLDQSLPATHVLLAIIGTMILCVCVGLYYLQAAPAIGTLKLMGTSAWMCLRLFMGYTAFLTLAIALFPAILHSLFAWSFRPMITTMTCVGIAIILPVPVLLSHCVGSPIRLLPAQ